MKSRKFISFVIPAKDEAESLPILLTEIGKAVTKTSYDYEIIVIDDGSQDNTFQVLRSLKNKKLRTIKHRGNFGKSIALQNGFNLAKGEIVITMDADLQDDPKEIPQFIKMIESGYDMVSGWKKRRFDPISKTLPSRIGNFATRLLTGINIHDLNCGFKAYKKEVIESINLYGELYKYIPVLAMKQNFKVGEIVVSHRPRKYGKSKFGWTRNIKGFIDMLTVVFLTGYIKKPGHFFGTLGIVSFSFGFAIGLYITYLRVTTGSIQYRHPLLFLGMLLMMVGVQLISTGLLAEMMIFSQQKSDYKSVIKEVA